MKFLITESELNRFIVNYMNRMYHPDDLKIVRYENHPESIFYEKNDELVMSKDSKDNIFYFDWELIWSYFKNDLGLSEEQIKEGLEVWLGETMNIMGFYIDFRYNMDLYAYYG